MATRTIRILNNKRKGSPNDPDWNIKSRDHELIGVCWNKQGPQDEYLDGKLNGHAIITNKELKEYRKLKRNN